MSQNDPALPSWKQELITTNQQARDFFERALKEQGVEGYIETWKQQDFYPSSYREITISVRPKHPPKSADEPNIIFFAHAYLFNGGILEIDQFHVSPRMFAGSWGNNDPYAGKKLSLIGLKALIGSATEYLGLVSRIVLKEVEQDGPRYWSHLGGFPVGGRYNCTPHVSTIWGHLKEEMAHYPKEEWGPLPEIVELAQDFPTLAYRALAAIKPSGQRFGSKLDRICEEVVEELCCRSHDAYMAVDMKDPSTLKIMRDKLGPLPCCPAAGWHYNDVAIEAAKWNQNTALVRRMERFEEMMWEEERRRHRLDYG